MLQYTSLLKTLLVYALLNMILQLVSLLTLGEVSGSNYVVSNLKHERRRSLSLEKKNQLDITECFIALMICSTCFGHFYVHYQELETIRVLLPSMVCSAWLLVVGGQVQSSRLCVQEEGCCTTAVAQHPYFWTHSLLLRT